MSSKNELSEARIARANALAALQYFDKVISRLEGKDDKKPGRDYSAVDAKMIANNNKKFRKLTA